MYVVRDSFGGERDVKPVTPERDSFVRISVTDADDHTTQQITESRTHSLANISIFYYSTAFTEQINVMSCLTDVSSFTFT